MQVQTPSPAIAYLTRQLDIIPIDCLSHQITIIGAGAIGSFTALSLAKMGFGNITVFDDDVVSVENMNCSLFRPGDIDTPKVTALADIIYQFTGVRIEGIAKRYTGGMFPGIVISAVDSMQARRLIWENHASRAPMTKAIIDPRMGAEVALMYVMQPMSEQDAQSYEKTLYTDENAVQEKCTAKATIYTANMLSGLVVKAVKDIATGNKYPRITMWSILENDFKSWSSSNDNN